MNIRFPVLLAFVVLVFNATGQDVYDSTKIAEIRIVFSESNWRKALSAIRESGQEERLIADRVTVNGQQFTGAGVRFKGNSSYNNVKRAGQEKLPLNIKLNQTNPDQALPSGHTTLKLANGFRDPSMVREVLAYEIVRSYMPAPRASFAKVYINEQYQGIYTNVESIDKTFLSKHLGESSGGIVKSNPNWQWKPPAGCPEKRYPTLQYLGSDTLCYEGIYEVKGESVWEAHLNFAKALNTPGSNLADFLDTDQALWMLALNNVLVNLDSYIGGFAQNYYLYYDTMGIVHPLIWDLNLAFGGFRLLTERQVLDNTALQTLSLFVHHRERNAERPLILRLLDDELLRKIYVAHCKTILEDYFFNGRYQERMRYWQQLAAPVVEKDPLYLYKTSAFRENAHTGIEAHGEQIMGITELMEERIAYFKRHPLITAATPALGAIQQEKAPNGGVLIQVQAAQAKRVWLFAKEPGQRNFTRRPMQEGQPGTWSAAQPVELGTHFYLVAENDATAALLPQRAGAQTLQAH